MKTRVFLTAAIVAAGAAFASGATARAQDLTSCTSSIRVLFNQYGNETIPTGATLWFSGVLERVESAQNDLGANPVRIDVRHSRVTFGEWPYTIDLPDSTIQIDSSATNPQRWFVNRSSWSVTFAPSMLPEAFFTGMPYSMPEQLFPGDSGSATWTATFTASRPGITLTWAWSAAVYSRFGDNGRLLVKPLKAPIGEPQPAIYQNDDPAGTPELYKQYVVAGAMGNGAPQYTGARSAPATVQPCVSKEAPPPAAFSTRAVNRCDTGDLCAEIGYENGDRLAIYSEGATNCDRYSLYLKRTNGSRVVYAFSRPIASLCGYATASMSMDSGHIRLTISRNADGSLKFKIDAKSRLYYYQG
jgi:hypothetical protein